MIVAGACVFVLSSVGAVDPVLPQDRVPGSVDQVVDGDTVVVMLADESLLTVHLWGIDAPELGQPGGVEARDCLEQVVGGQTVTLPSSSVGQSEVTATVLVNGADLSNLMISRGFAWLADTGDTSDDYAVVLFVARSAGKGLWIEDYSSLVHPARWREQHLKNGPAPTPTPTPIPTSLSGYAKASALTADGDQDIVIDKIPTKEVRQREERTLATALSRLGREIRKINGWTDRLLSDCDETPPSDDADGETTYWSDEEQRWVTEMPSNRQSDCFLLRNQIMTSSKYISEQKSAAVNRARRFGLSDSFIDKTVRRYGLEDY
jgi:endonuclease YncB( thermonuclease family)